MTGFASGGDSDLPTPSSSTATPSATVPAVTSTTTATISTPAPRPPPVYSSRPAAKPPARIGAPPSSRNFGDSSASGPGRAPPPRFAKPGYSGRDAGGAGVGGGGQGTVMGSSSLASMSEVDQDEREKKRETWGKAYVPEEDSIRNDYSLHYVKTGSRPQNHLRGADVEDRFAEYPKLNSLLKHKHALLASPQLSIPPTYLLSNPETALPTLSPTRFDVILLSPPPEMGYDALSAIDLSRVASTPGFVWLWVGTGVRGNGIGLEKGRELIANWGYRRCEDIVWLKTNKKNPAADLEERPDTELFTPTIEHCLMGIRGTVRRSNDPWFVHCNVDTDVMIWEGDAADPQLKPPELQTLIENFCLGTRRLHLFGSPLSLRRGWLTVGSAINPAAPIRPVEGEDSSEWEAVEFDKDKFGSVFESRRGAGEEARFADAGLSRSEEQARIPILLPFVEELDALRPKSPVSRTGVPSSGGLGRGRGAGLGITRSPMVPQNRGAGSWNRVGGSFPPPYPSYGFSQQPPMHQQPYSPQTQMSGGQNAPHGYYASQAQQPYLPYQPYANYPAQPTTTPQPQSYQQLSQQPFPYSPPHQNQSHHHQLHPPSPPPPSSQQLYTPFSPHQYPQYSNGPSLTPQQQQDMFQYWVAMGGPQQMMAGGGGGSYSLPSAAGAGGQAYQQEQGEHYQPHYYSNPYTNMDEQARRTSEGGGVRQPGG